MTKHINQAYLIKIGERLRRRRKECGFSLEDVSAMTGLSINTISSIENGRDTYLSNCLVICPALNFKPQDLFNIEIQLEPLFQLPPDRKERSLTTHRIHELVDSGFFATPRLVNSVIEEFYFNYGVQPPSSEVSSVLKKLTDQGRLEYTKVGRKNMYREKIIKQE